MLGCWGVLLGLGLVTSFGGPWVPEKHPEGSDLLPVPHKIPFDGPGNQWLESPILDSYKASGCHLFDIFLYSNPQQKRCFRCVSPHTFPRYFFDEIHRDRSYLSFGCWACYLKKTMETWSLKSMDWMMGKFTGLSPMIFMGKSILMGK